jgi:hypothetical protein
MDWQDELRRLDKQLSEGDISAQDYRRMRDELLAEASAPAQGRGSMWSSARPDGQSPQEPAPPAPPAPAPTPPPAPVARADAEETQIVENDTQVVDEAVVASVDSPTAVHTVGPPVTPGMPLDDPDRTTTVAAETVATSGPKEPSFPAQPGARARPAPPLPAPAPWTGQVLGEEVFATAKPGGGRRPAKVALSVLVALAVVGGAVWFFAIRSDDSAASPQEDKPPPNTQSEAPPPSEPKPSKAPDAPPPNLADALGPLPGAADKNNGTLTPQRVGTLKLVAPAEVELATDHKVKDVIFRGSTNGTVGNALLVFATPSPAEAIKFTDAERAYLQENGFEEGRPLAGGLPVLERSDEAGTVYRVVYTTGKYTVRLGVAQRDAKPADLRKELEAAADTILAVLPPS